MTTPESAGGTDPDVVDAEVIEQPMASSSAPVLPGADASTTLPDPDYSAAGVPSFDFVRDKIEKRVATAIGSEVLAESSTEGQQADEALRKRTEAAKKKLDEIRKSMGGA
ncbi:PspA domain-containing protein [Gordonia sp. (in: high G+C Gram-positive bacteria)]|uniref:PspA domain-containing protein n=1 Tax=Gordonia sp. (in: high G+C Gram-positive bacteria) TaxID=84139 RepID=UPI002B856283|nr:PspA domain-containing protein [Gordonia sp. (in: high G+C Gram-positive bacteria)]HMS73948.1 PspA domain-containing protein [Gordonia sp. (in: high G+C Gram-positive bacteria)]HQV16735.1 PspA domain-containing protein [Gordonia sp. (in: high G+C Gram-positive bacteria)]